jgi:hypothetical protein
VTQARLRDLLAVVLLLAASLPLGVLATRIAYDDAWITYRYAYNLATGSGLVYNAGERFLGTTAPGEAVLLAALGVLTPESIPAIGGALSAAALAAIALGLYAFGRVHGDWIGGLAAGLLIAVNPIALEAFGGEMLPQTALVVWALVAEARRRWLLAVILASGATILRPDGVLVLALVGAHQTWVRRALPWREIAVSAAILGVWFGALWLYYGWPLPYTLAAKRAQRLSGIWHPLGMDLVEWFKARTPSGSVYFGAREAPGFVSLLALAGLGLPCLLGFRQWLLVVAWPAVYLIAYRQLHLPFYHWYAVPPLLAVVVSAGAACAALGSACTWTVRRLAPHAYERLTPGARSIVPAPVLLVLALVIVWPMARHSAALTRSFPNQVERAYDRLGRWLASNTPAGASVGYLEIGIMGFHARRPIVDPLGLVNPGVAPQVARSDLLWAYRTFRPDYIVHNPVFFPGLLGVLVDQPWFTAEYRRVTELDSGRGADTPLTIYRRVGPDAPAGATPR